MRFLYTLLLAALLPTLTQAQNYQTNGTAAEVSPMMGARCFRLTTAEFNQNGSVWNTAAVDLRQAFTINARLYFGTKNDGADGIAFMLQNAGGTNYLGNWGAGIGYHRFNGTYPSDISANNPGPVPSVILEFDTYQNGMIGNANIGDPVEDHAGFMSMSNAYHTSATTLKAPEGFNIDIEDGQWHDVAFSWNPGTSTLSAAVNLNNGSTQTFSYTGDIIADQLSNNPMAYWGFTSSTGQGSSSFANEQKVCIITPQTPPPPPPVCGQLRTQTPGGWGAKPSGNNNGTYLYANFNNTFSMSGGLTVGSGANIIRLTSAPAVTAFLPSAGTPAALAQSYVNPTSREVKNTLAGHLVALTLSVSFDRMNADFAPSSVQLGSMVIKSGPFAGKTVDQFLAIANQILGGVTTTGFTIQQAVETATAINENNVDGKGDNGYLSCPPSTASSSGQRAYAAPSVTPAGKTATETLTFPNPTGGPVQVRLQPGEGRARIEVLSPGGQPVEGRSVALTGNVQTITLNLARHASGQYLIRIQRPDGVEVSRVVLSR